MTWARLHELEEAVKLVKADWKKKHGNLTEDIRDRIGKTALKIAAKTRRRGRPKSRRQVLGRLAN